MADLTRVKQAGKFGKLLRSDPRLNGLLVWLWWCRVCLLF